MKQKFSLSWKGSVQPRKQRKYRVNAPWFVKRKLLSVNLAKELRKKYGKRNFPVRKGDNVKIIRGEFKGKSGNITEVRYDKLQVLIEGIYRSKKDGTKIAVPFHPSHLQIRDLALDDAQRKTALERKKGAEKVKEKEKKELQTKTTFKKLPKETGGKK
jgi:large subunit ribosomal protein L24